MSNATHSSVRGNPRDPGENGRTAFGGIDKSAVRYGTDQIDFTAIQRSPEFRALRRRLTTFIVPATAFFLIWYLVYVVLAAYATDFMAQRVYGEINVGLLMGVGQFATTLLLTALYSRYARTRLDPQVDELRENAGGA